MSKNRYIGEYPVIGIRPIVDGRRGPQMMRESLEPLVWAMAEAAKKLFEDNLHYSNGQPVKVVLADTCIGRVLHAADPRMYAYCAHGADLPSGGLERLWYGQGRSGLPGLCHLRTFV